MLARITTVFVKSNEQVVIILYIHVDDILLTGDDNQGIAELKQYQVFENLKNRTI